jgi:hypothetical protein
MKPITLLAAETRNALANATAGRSRFLVVTATPSSDRPCVSVAFATTVEETRKTALTF